MTPVKLLDRTLRLLGAFSASRPEWGVTELAAWLPLPKSTVHRILRVLTAHRYLAQDPATGRFRLGLGALELGRHAQQGLELRRVALPVLQRLGDASGETVLLMVPSETRDRAVCIERVESSSRLRLILEVGTHAPLHAGASSKVLLAHMTREEIDRVVAAGLPRLARGTITSPTLLRRDLLRIRRRGHAVSREETNEGAAGVAAPILDREGRIVAGVSLVGPLGRFTDRRRPALIALAREGVAAIGRTLGLGEPAVALGRRHEQTPLHGDRHGHEPGRRGNPGASTTAVGARVPSPAPRGAAAR